MMHSSGEAWGKINNKWRTDQATSRKLNSPYTSQQKVKDELRRTGRNKAKSAITASEPSIIDLNEEPRDSGIDTSLSLGGSCCEVVNRTKKLCFGVGVGAEKAHPNQI